MPKTGTLRSIRIPRLSGWNAPDEAVDRRLGILDFRNRICTKGIGHANNGQNASDRRPELRNF
jgi:hypothetical protein